MIGGDKASTVDSWLEKLSQNAGKNGKPYTVVLPKMVTNKISYTGADGEQVDVYLGGADYLAYAEQVQKTACDLVYSYMNGVGKTASTEQQAKFAVDARNYAVQTARQNFIDGYEVTDWIADVQAQDMDPAESIAAYAAVKTAKSDKDAEGNTVSGSKAKNAVAAMVDQGFKEGEARALYESLSGNEDSQYLELFMQVKDNPQQVDDLAALFGAGGQPASYAGMLNDKNAGKVDSYLKQLSSSAGKSVMPDYVEAMFSYKISTSAALTENKKRLLVAEADYLYSLKMDIESFFPNLYTHNFEKMANKIPFSKLDADFRYFQFLDRFHQRINNNQTKGIPAGTFSSHIAAELCMLCVDEEIRTYLKNCKNPVGYVRYVDDLNFFSDSESELAELYPAIQSILNKYRLRINGNKTEAIHAVYTSQAAYLAEIEQEFPKLKISDSKQTVSISDFFLLKRYIGKCLKESRSSQIRGILTLVLRRLQGNNLSIDEISDEFFYYLLKLVFEDVSLTAHIYRLLDFILENTLDSTPLIAALKKKKSKIDAEYPDTIFQIWHYYILFRHSNHEDQINMIATLKDKHFNPLLAACMVLSGKGKNKELYKIIRDAYIQESGSSQWQSEIMNSKWWLPLFKISRYDSHDYDHFMKSNNFPPLLKAFSTHDEEELE